MRRLSTLYRIAYGRFINVKEEEIITLCNLIATLRDDKLITFKEFKKLRKNLLENKPREWKHASFALDKDFIGEDNGFFWWEPGLIEPRKRFLKMMINYTKPWYVKLYLLWTNLLK